MADVLRKMRLLGEQVAQELDYELVLVQLVKEDGEWYLRFSLDRQGGISIQDCERYSRRIEPLIDADDPIQYRYTLEVASAGLDRPLVRQADYIRFTGREIAIRLYEPVGGRRQWVGKLMGLTEESGGVLVDLKTDNGQVTVPLAKIAQARLVPDL